MFKNYLLVAYRSLLQQKQYAIINIFGLAIGLTACILVAIFVESELGYDKHHADHQNIVRASLTMAVPGSPVQNFAMTQVQNADEFKRKFAQITDSTRLRTFGLTLGTVNNTFNDPGLNFADSNVFDFFAFDFIHGQAEGALTAPNSVVLTRSAAQKYFHREDVINETLTLSNRVQLKVTGVIADLPTSTHLEISSLVSMTTADSLWPGSNWRDEFSFNYFTYFKLAENTDLVQLEAQFPDFIDSIARFNARGGSKEFQYSLMPIADIYLHSHLFDEMKQNGDYDVVMSFTIVALLIMLIACINFMNLATATASKRAKEVGMRKVLGAQKSQLIAQFLTESIMLSFLALFIAVAFVEALLPTFSDFLGKTLALNYLTELPTLFTLLSVALAVGILSGLYPAFYLSAFKPAKVLKGEITHGKSGVLLRKMLVISQFTLAIILMISTIVSYLQLNYARNIALGYDKSNTVILDYPAENQYNTLINKLLTHPDIYNVTGSSRVPTTINGDSAFLLVPKTNERLLMPLLRVDYDFFKSYKIEVVAGRSFEPQFSSDIFVMPESEAFEQTIGVVINQKAARSLGFQDAEAVGKQFKMPFPGSDNKLWVVNIVGVVKDYYFSSLKTEIAPTYHLLQPENNNRLSIKHSGNVKEVSEYVENTWRELNPSQPIRMSFLDDNFDAMYAAEDKQITLFNLFSALAIFIACMGLYGLASFATQKRTKEIGIRKVIGASVFDIVVLISAEFSTQVLVANIIAWPIAWWLMESWLANFVYRIDISVMPFIISTTIAFLIAWLTVGGLAAMAAKSRPLEALRYE